MAGLGAARSGREGSVTGQVQHDAARLRFAAVREQLEQFGLARCRAAVQVRLMLRQAHGLFDLRRLVGEQGH